MKRIAFSACIGSLPFVLCCAALWAQAVAQISGTARDQSGAVLPGVEITATQTDTGITRNTITNETGSYVLPNLAIGPYRLEAGLPGFRTYVQTGLVLQVNSSSVINVALEVGQVAETVEVQANAALVETRSSTLGSVIENERILELPLNGRNVTDLITLAGAAVKQADSDTGGKWASGSPYLAVAGGAGYGVDYTLDGATHNSFMTGTSILMPFPDAMQEFKVETSGVGAERANSTAVAAVTKSGTNEFHGNLFEFVRNDLFNARNYFATTHSTLKRNQFGGTAGGPIVKNRLFFFGGFQATILRADPADRLAFIPTPAMMAGDWTAISSPTCNAGRQITLRAPFVNNRIDPALYSKPALYVVTRKTPLPFPTTNDPCGQITYGNMTAQTDINYVGKIDYQKSASHSLFGRILVATTETPDPSSFNTYLLQTPGWYSYSQNSYTLGSTYLIGAGTVHAFRLAVNRSANHFFGKKAFNWCDAGVNIYCAPEVQNTRGGGITGGFTIGNGPQAPGQKYVGTDYHLNDDVSLVRGSHQMAFGLSALHGRQNNFAIFASPSQFTFNGSAIGSGLADFMLGKPSTFFTGRSNAVHVNGTQVGVYAADTWKTTSRLTLNYGVRWDPFLPQWTDSIYNFNYDRFRQGIKSSVFLNAPAGMHYYGDPGFPKSGINKGWVHFAPRLGLAWDVSGNGHTSIRASYAYSYIFVPGDFRETYSGGAPWGARVTISSPPGGLDDPWRDIPGGNIFPYELDKNTPFPPYGLFYSQRQDMKTPTTQAWNLSLQRQIAKDWLVTTSYMGSNIMHVWLNKPINPAIYIPGGPCTLNGVTYNPCSALTNTDARRKFGLERPGDGQKLGIVTDGDDGGTQVYHGMLLSVQRRAAEGVTVTANYTWSHCIGPYGMLYQAMGYHPDNTYTDPNNRNTDRGSCDSDRRHIFNLTTVAETPQFSNPTLRILATGWRLSGIFRWSAGNPLNIIAGSDRALNGIANQRANQLTSNPFGDKSAGPMSRYLNPAAFALPDLGTTGNIGLNSVQGPRTWSFDMAVSRVFRFRESQRLEFRAEAYNVTNSFRPGNPIAAVNNANFGVIRTSLDPRILQFALKYFF